MDKVSNDILDKWNKNFFDWCWTCFDAGQKLTFSDSWALDKPELANKAKSFIQAQQTLDQLKYNYFSANDTAFIMSIPQADLDNISILLPGILFLIKEHVNFSVSLLDWTYWDNMLTIYFMENTSHGRDNI